MGSLWPYHNELPLHTEAGVGQVRHSGMQHLPSLLAALPSMMV